MTTLPSTYTRPATEQSSTPIPAAKAKLDAITQCESALEPHGVAGNVITAARAPSTELREWMTTRVTSLNDALRPALMHEMADELKKLFTVCAVRDSAEKNTSLFTQTYMEDLADLPMFALKSACTYFRRHSKWAPEISEIRDKALAEVQIFRNERHRIQKVLDARVLPREASEDRKAEVLRHYREVIRPALQATSMREASLIAKRVPPTPEELAAYAAIEKGLPDPRPPITRLSPEARKAIGLPADDPRDKDEN